MSPNKPQSNLAGPSLASGLPAGSDAIRALLRRDYLTTADWDAALRDFAQMASQALAADESLVAIYDAETKSWTACTSAGKKLSDRSISLYGSRTVLENVRRAGAPVLTSVEEPLLVTSDSLEAHEVRSVVAVPIFFWDAKRGASERSFGGCLYAHRSGSRPPFVAADIELVRDLTELAQRTLNLVRYVGGVEKHLEASEAELGQLRQSAAKRYSLGSSVTREPWFAQRVLEPLRQVSYATKVNLLLLGPTGSGKSHLAQAYHYASPRKGGPFVVLDCSQVLSAETLGPELFGYARDSGYANAPKKGLAGKAELAHQGTLFIDEIGSLPPVLQQKLLRVIQTGRFAPLGTSEERQVDLQIIAATNEEPEELVRQGRFRDDLYQRLGELTVRLPPLSQRALDVPELAEEFLRMACERFGRQDVAGFTPEALTALMRHDWSREGNIRGLEFTVNRSVLMSPSGVGRLDQKHLCFVEAAGAERGSKRSAERGSRVAPLSADEAELRELMSRKIREHRAKLSALAEDPEVLQALAEGRERLPVSTLRLRIRMLDLEPLVQAERSRRDTLEPAVLEAALREHGSAARAAEALGLSSDALAWQLRKAGLKVRTILSRR